jgi:hypothetical protein
MNGKLKHPFIAQFNTHLKEKCGSEITKRSPNVFMPANTELKYLKKTKIMDKENDENESG